MKRLLTAISYTLAILIVLMIITAVALWLVYYHITVFAIIAGLFFFCVTVAVIYDGL